MSHLWPSSWAFFFSFLGQLPQEVGLLARGGRQTFQFLTAKALSACNAHFSKGV